MSQNAVCQLTESAALHVKRLMQKQNKEGSMLRISVVGGGCSGMSYKMSFEGSAGDSDTAYEQHGVFVLVDPKSSLFLKGLTVDYIDDLNGSGFVYENPNAKKSCGCGTSFSA